MKAEFQTLLTGRGVIEIENPDHGTHEEVTECIVMLDWRLDLNVGRGGIVEAPSIYIDTVRLDYTLEDQEEVGEVERIATDRGTLEIEHQATREERLIVRRLDEGPDAWTLTACIDGNNFWKDGLKPQEAFIDYKENTIQINF